MKTQTQQHPQEREQDRFRSYYAAKTARHDKDKPTDWLILPDGGWHRLVHIGENRCTR